MKNRCGYRIAVLLLAAFTNSAWAGDYKCHHGPKIELDSLKPEISPIQGGWQFGVKYKVKIEDGPAPGPLVLAIQIQECGQFLMDETGQPLTILVPLEQPTKCEDDEVEFKARTAITLPVEVIRCPDRLRAFGSVRIDGSNQVLASKSKSVKFRDGGCCNNGEIYVNVQIGGW